MTTPALCAARPSAIPFADILPWAIFGGLLFAIGLYFVGVEQGATALFDGAASGAAKVWTELMAAD